MAEVIELRPYRIRRLVQRMYARGRVPPDTMPRTTDIDEIRCFLAEMDSMRDRVPIEQTQPRAR